MSPRTPLLLADMRREWDALDTRIATLDREFIETARHSAMIPGIGALNATALVAAVARRKASRVAGPGRPGKPRLGGITKRGNVYRRTMLIHGARAALPCLSRSRRRSGPGCAS